MREIRFRAKTLTNKWIQGHPVCINFMNNQWVMYNNSLWYNINPNTLCEYTGIEDKNGNMIFEGDIIKNSDNGKMFVVRYICGGYDLEPVEEYYKKCKITWNTLGEMQNADFCETTCEIIGNIYDNPELLKGEE